MTENSSTQYLILKDDHWHECLEDSYGFLRASWKSNWLGMPAVLGHCMRFLNLDENHFSKAARSMLDAAQSVALEIENQNQITPSLTEPNYHNRLHFADALTSMSILLSILFQLEKKVNHDWMACALLTCIAHDFLHPGKVNRFESEIENKSVNFLKPILSLHRVPDEWQKIISTAIVRSDFATVHHNHANVNGKSFEWDLKWLCVLLNEADVMASASSKYGPELGESLAQEWRLIDFPLHASVASIEGRKNFLKQLLFSSPASLVLGLNERVSDEIRSMLPTRI
jgi:3'5'-cyclic nucleotide phosphodiesterase